MAKWQIELTATANKQLAKIKDNRIQKSIYNRIKKLEENPELQGKALIGPLASYRSVRAVGQRYRIIYKIFQEKVVVMVVGIGLRKEGDKMDVYNQAQFLLKHDALESGTQKPEKE
jgi:mRNA interferase RelE/StbE